MPTIEQLEAMCKELGINYSYFDISIDLKTKVMGLTIASIQAKALSDIASNMAFKKYKR